MLKLFSFFLLFLIVSDCAYCQREDTVIIGPGNVNTSFLKEGPNRYLVYFKNGRDSNRIKYQFWTRKIDFITYQGRDAISVSQQWEDNDTIIHKVYSVCDRKTFAPLFHEAWWKGYGSLKFDFINQIAYARDTLLKEDKNPMVKNAYTAFKEAAGQFVLNWHLDLEVFSILPFRNNRTFLIKFYDPGYPAPKYEVYKVTGSATLPGYNNKKIDCWVLDYQSSKETFYISKKTHEVLQLVQESKGKFRYKIKLPYGL